MNAIFGSCLRVSITRIILSRQRANLWSLKLENVVPLGRSLDEYRLIYNLEDADFTKKIAGVADGVSSFNTEMNAMGHRVTSIDPLYEFSGEYIEKRFYASIDNVVEQLRATQEDYNWTYFKSPEDYKKGPG